MPGVLGNSTGGSVKCCSPTWSQFLCVLEFVYDICLGL